jgi:hypothetical protein
VWCGETDGRPWRWLTGEVDIWSLDKVWSGCRMHFDSGLENRFKMELYGALVQIECYCW